MDSRVGRDVHRRRWTQKFGGISARQRVGNDILSANYPEDYQTVLFLPLLLRTKGIDEFVPGHANSDRAG